MHNLTLFFLLQVDLICISKMIFLRLRYQQLRSEIIRGWYEVPYLYFTIGLVIISVGGISYKLAQLDNKDHHYARHKHHYVVLRPDDVRLPKYPRKFITDRAVLEDYEKRQQENKK